MKSKRYCFVNVIKEEFIKRYKELHINPWKEILDAIKGAGVKELLIWNYQNLAIIYYECDDIDRVYAELGKLDINDKWNKVLTPWFQKSPVIDVSGGIATLDKIFDLNEQLKGNLTKY